MLTSVKSEFRKLLSVRSTYIVTLLGLGLIGFVSFYANGMRAEEFMLQRPGYLAGNALTGANVMAIFIAIIALLLVTHEYRYNTIMHTLTNSNSRTKSFLAKLFVIGVFSVVATLLVSIFAPLMAYLGANTAGMSLAPQEFYGEYVWRGLYFGFGNAMAAALLAFIIRNQVGAIVTFFIVINTAEGLLSILLKENTKYLPFTALQGVVNVTARSGGGPETVGMEFLSPGRGALVFGIYAATGLIVAWLLFIRRDAN